MKIGYSGHKHQKGTKELVLVENNGYVVAPLVTASVNINDISLFPEGLEGFMDFADLIGLDVRETILTLDSGFDSIANHDRIVFHGLTPVIKPNPRRTKDETKIYERLEQFDETTYKQRFKVERTFAWADNYRKLVTRYERLEETHVGFKCLAYAMINLRKLL